MDAQTGQSLVRLIRTQRVAALGALSDTGPLVSMVQYVASADLSAFYIHVSRLALHTQCLLRDRRASLLIAEPDLGERDPQTLGRVSIRGEAVETQPTAGHYEKVKSAYLEKFPKSTVNFGLGDFILYGIRPHHARYVAGFGQIFDLTADDFRRIASISA